jgi:hypothetical protein
MLHSSLSGLLVSFEENEVLRIWSLVSKLKCLFSSSHAGGQDKLECFFAIFVSLESLEDFRLRNVIHLDSDSFAVTPLILMMFVTDY